MAKQNDALARRSGCSRSALTSGARVFFAGFAVRAAVTGNTTAPAPRLSASESPARPPSSTASREVAPDASTACSSHRCRQTAPPPSDTAEASREDAGKGRGKPPQPRKVPPPPPPDPSDDTTSSRAACYGFHHSHHHPWSSRRKNCAPKPKRHQSARLCLISY